jgi:GAF domain-containing protein
MALQAVPEAEAATTTVAHGQTLETHACTDDFAVALDRMQHSTGEGPCFTSITTKKVVRADVEELRSRWPAFMALAEPEGLRDSMSAPLIVHGESVGSLNLYSQKEHAFDGSSEELVTLFASLAGMIVLNYLLYSTRGELVEQLYEALESRAGIDIAKGILVERMGLSADEAFDHLRKESQRRNIKLHTVAMEVVGSPPDHPRNEEISGVR